MLQQGKKFEFALKQKIVQIIKGKYYRDSFSTQKRHTIIYNGYFIIPNKVFLVLRN